VKHTWSEFKLRVNINTPVENAYRAWATQQGLESWFLRQALITGADGNQRKASSPIEKGDSYEWYWHGYPDSIVVQGKITETNGKDRFGFTFSMGCPVSISIYRECDETIVELREHDLPADEETAIKYYTDDSKGWLFYLVNLKSVLEGGMDLRNKKLELTNVITA
jgi:uncharacterized protein YndB with AHSA1/START domain